MPNHNDHAPQKEPAKLPFCIQISDMDMYVYMQVEATKK